MVSSQKICNHCKRELPLSAFAKKSESRDGRKSRCRECYAALFQERYKDPEWRKTHILRTKKYREKLRSEDPTQLWARDSLANAKRRAKQDDLPFEITLRDLLELVVDTCPLLGLPLVYTADGLRSNAATLDKKYPNKGYTPGNIGIISHRANRLKSDSSIEELQTLLNNLIRYMASA